MTADLPTLASQRPRSLMWTHRRSGRQAIRPDVKRHGSLPGARCNGLAHNACLGIWAEAWFVVQPLCWNRNA